MGPVLGPVSPISVLVGRIFYVGRLGNTALRFASPRGR
jgi:hypothetical protein